LIAQRKEISPSVADGFWRKDYVAGHRISTDVNLIGLREPELDRQAYRLAATVDE